MAFIKENWAIVVYIVTLLIGIGEYIARFKEFDRRIIKLEEQSSDINKSIAEMKDSNNKSLSEIKEKLVELKTIINIRSKDENK
jgi:predicted RND superfamily exporter protein